jgi:mono/diheme cytochrome c family protein
MGQFTAIVATGILLLLVVASCTTQPSPSGGDLFAANCASCHGRYAEGDGPAGAAMARAIPDLRYLAANNGGVFPRGRLEDVIDGRAFVKAHGDREMPVWGEAFATLSGPTRSAQARAAANIHALVDYLATIQKD